MIRRLHGIAHGKTIQLDEDSGVAADGQEVEVLITVSARQATGHNEKSGNGFLRTEGALADDDQWDGIMDEIYQARKNDQRLEAPELE